MEHFPSTFEGRREFIGNILKICYNVYYQGIDMDKLTILTQTFTVAEFKLLVKTAIVWTIFEEDVAQCSETVLGSVLETILNGYRPQGIRFKENLEMKHLLQALQYLSMERNYIGMQPQQSFQLPVRYENEEGKSDNSESDEDCCSDCNPGNCILKLCCEFCCELWLRWLVVVAVIITIFVIVAILNVF